MTDVEVDARREEAVGGPDQHVEALFGREPADGPDDQATGGDPEPPLRLVASMRPRGKVSGVDGVLDQEAPTLRARRSSRQRSRRSSETQMTRS